MSDRTGLLALTAVLAGALAACTTNDYIMQPTRTWESEVPPPVQAPDHRTVSEGQICRQLAGARVLVDEVPGGVALTLRRTERVSIEQLRTATGDLEKGLAPGSRILPADRKEDRCDLADLAAHAPTVGVEPTAEGVKIQLTTEDAGDVATLRLDARGFAAEIQ